MHETLTTDGMNPSEALVTRLCQRAFLRLWTHPNPKGKKGKELCDCLIVCGRHVVIVSVKDIKFKDTGDKTGWERWHKDAVDGSVTQIWGAERWLATVDKVVRRDGRTVTLPPKSERVYHRMAVALGGRGAVPIKWGDFGNGFIHVCDEHSLEALFMGADTIGDLLDFLSAVEAQMSKPTKVMFSGSGLEDLLALYLVNGPSFGFDDSDRQGQGVAVLLPGIWDGYRASNVYAERAAALENSYAWDRLIEHLASDLLTDGMVDMFSKSLTQDDLALVAMALQRRDARLHLATAFLDFLVPNGKRVASRCAVGENATAFVFLAGSSGDREHRSQELGLRCLVVRVRVKDIVAVVGIATDRPGTSAVGYSCDLAYLEMDRVTPDDEAAVAGIQKDLGFFKALAP